MDIALFAPLYTEEERNYYAAIESKLAKNGINNIACKLDIELNNCSLDDGELPNLALANDIFLIAMKCDTVIGVLNGRVPDEITTIRLGMAYAMGLNVLLFKEDYRIAFPTGDNSMILGLTRYNLQRDISKLIKLVQRISAKSINKPLINPSIIELVSIGQEVYSNSKEGRREILANIRSKNNHDSSFKDRHLRVYCSGPLFAPSEQWEMRNLAYIIEQRGHSAYLPQRDGAEPYFLPSSLKLLSSALIAKPFTNVINKMIFNIDVAEIVRCDCFLLNLNGRAYDEGAMAEAGMAFVMGKPIILFNNDNRTMLPCDIHPYLSALSNKREIICDYEKVADALEKIVISEVNAPDYLPIGALKAVVKGRRSLKLLRSLRKIRKDTFIGGNYE